MMGGASQAGEDVGMSGARMAMTLVHQLKKTGGKPGLARLCIGIGQGLAFAVRRV